MDARNSPIPTPPAQRIEDFKQRRLPLVVWSVAAIVCLIMLTGRLSRFETIGLAQALQYEVSAETVGRVQTVIVDVYDDVQAGDIVAQLDGSRLEATITTANARIRQLGAELESARAQMLSNSNTDRTNWAADLRRFKIDEEQRRLEALEIRVAIESDEIEFERLNLLATRNKPLFESGFLGEQEYDDSRLMRDETQRRLEENKRLLAQTEEEYLAARARRQSFEDGLPQLPDSEPLLQPLREAITVQTMVLQEVQVERSRLVLRSPATGQVSQILCRAGQSVVPGEPILTIAERTPREIVTYLQEGDDRRIAASDRVTLSRLSQPSKTAESVVVRVGSALELMPGRLWQEPGMPGYGRAVVIAGVPDLRLAPGERVDVRFKSRP